MENKSVGELISTLRKEKGMTQKDVADRLGITDKAVSKWERELAYPDTATLPRLAEILEISVEDLLNAKASPAPKKQENRRLSHLILKAIATAMGIAVTVTALLGTLDTSSGFAMTGIGLACIGILLLRTDL